MYGIISETVSQLNVRISQYTKLGPAAILQNLRQRWRVGYATKALSKYGNQLTSLVCECVCGYIEGEVGGRDWTMLVYKQLLSDCILVIMATHFGTTVIDKGF